jgi:hypothetical protein
MTDKKVFTKDELIEKVTVLHEIIGMDVSRMELAFYIAGYNDVVTLEELKMLSEMKKEGYIV